MAKIDPSATVTVIIPAYNEEGNIVAAVESAATACRSAHVSYELLILDDGSTDQTPQVTQKLTKKMSQVRVIRHPVNQGLGASFRTAIAYVTTPYVTVFPGDNDMASDSLLDLLQKRDAAELIFSYPQDTRKRGVVRRFLSAGYIRLMNTVFDLSVRYYNGPFICKTELLQSLSLTSVGLDVFAELKVRLLKKQVTYLEIPFDHTGRHQGVSKAVNIKSIIRTLQTIVNLLRDPTL